MFHAKHDGVTDREEDAGGTAGKVQISELWPGNYTWSPLCISCKQM